MQSMCYSYMLNYIDRLFILMIILTIYLKLFEKIHIINIYDKINNVIVLNKGILGG